MPTPTGLLRKGDRVRHIESGAEYEVVERVGNDVNYSVYIKHVRGPAVLRYRAPCRNALYLLTEAGWWILPGHGWEVVNSSFTGN